MIAADRPRSLTATRLLYVDAAGGLHHALRAELVNLLRRGDVVVANDAATLPASLRGVHSRTGSEIEVRLAGRAAADEITYLAIVFGAGDHHMRTEDRALPPALLEGDELQLGPLLVGVEALLDHPRLARLRFKSTLAEFWRGLAAHGRAIQYAHVRDELELWDVWTAIAGPPVAYEAPSAGFVLDWRTIQAMQRKGVTFATLTHAAGISSTGDATLDARLPFDEPYFIPAVTAVAINAARLDRRRIIAIGTTVVRALEHAGATGVVAAGAGVADQRIGAGDHARIVEAIISGTHEVGTSHYELLRAFMSDAVLAGADSALQANAYRTHEFGDFVFIEKASRRRNTLRYNAIGRVAFAASGSSSNRREMKVGAVEK